ncbi:hypothetical protein TIFTF001_012249 [Ficus carica]|uniref:Uncharacterized protein n=1 Tax=Ficus carica TaxID=3494 RepID=A0AA88D1J3_FICCA|nr:hypothetical protein TIFTF001_012249 [Ficus carica]
MVAEIPFFLSLSRCCLIVGSRVGERPLCSPAGQVTISGFVGILLQVAAKVVRSQSLLTDRASTFYGDGGGYCLKKSALDLSSSEGGDTVAWKIAPPSVPEDPSRNEFAIDRDGASWGRSLLGSKSFLRRSWIFPSETTNPKVPLPRGCADDAGDSSLRDRESGEALRSGKQPTERLRRRSYRRRRR